MIEFKLNENGDSQAVQTAYIEAGLPANGPTVEGEVFLIFNAHVRCGSGDGDYPYQYAADYDCFSMYQTYVSGND